MIHRRHRYRTLRASQKERQERLTHLGPREEPPILEWINEISTVVGNAGSRITDMELAFNRSKCLWEGQSEDGRKNADDMGCEPSPYEGASDARIHIIETIINERLGFRKMALSGGMPTARPREPGDVDSAAHVITLLDDVKEQNAACLRDELDYLMRWSDTYGSAILHVSWREKRELVRREVSLSDVLEMVTAAGLQMSGLNAEEPASEQEAVAVQTMTQDLSREAWDIFTDPDRSDMALQLLTNYDPEITPQEAKRLLKRMRAEGAGDYYAATVVRAWPEWTALLPYIHVLFPEDTEDLAEAPWVTRIHWVTAVRLEEWAATEGWDMDWVEEVKTRKGHGHGLGDVSNHTWLCGGRGVRWALTEDDAQRGRCYQILERISRVVGEPGVPITYRTILHADVDGYAIHGPLPYVHGEMPFHLLRFERHEKLILSSRGIPEIIFTEVDCIKAQTDGQRDRTGWMNNPVAVGDMFKQGVRIPLAPGDQLPNRRSGQVSWLTPPPMDLFPEKIIEQSTNRLDRMFGLPNPAVPEAIQRMQMQILVDDMLAFLKAPFRQTFELVKQYFPPDLINAIVGLEEGEWDIAQVSAHDVSMSYDVTDLNLEWVTQKLKGIAELVIPLDNAGLIDREPLVKMAMAAIFPQMAKAVVLSGSSAAEKERKDELEKIGLMATGIEPDFVMGGNHQLRLQVMQETIQKSPRLQRLVTEDPDVKALFEARGAAHEQQLMQAENRITGATGYQEVQS